jgi:hypothetical protein
MADDNKKKFGDFVSKLRDVGIAKPNLFFVEMPPPPFLAQEADQSKITMLNLFCQQAFLPQMQLNTMGIKDDGLDRQVVVDKKYGNAQFVFLCDQDMVIRQYFDDWLQDIVATRGGTFAYANEYTVDTITVNQLNAARDIVYSVKLHDCMPLELHAMGLSMSQTGSFHTISLDFSYRWWESNSASINLSNVPDDISTFLQNQSNQNIPGLPQIRSMNLNLRNPTNIFSQVTSAPAKVLKDVSSSIISNISPPINIPDTVEPFFDLAADALHAEVIALPTIL